jgi:hypothetical protein
LRGGVVRPVTSLDFGESTQGPHFTVDAPLIPLYHLLRRNDRLESRRTKSSPFRDLIHPYPGAGRDPVISTLQEVCAVFTTILLLAVTAGGEAADFGRRGGCNGCSGGCFGSGGGCYGCNGGRSGLFGGGGLFGRKHNGCNGCSGVVYSGCSASYGCSGTVYSGGCSGVVYGGGCTGGVVHGGGCTGGVVYGGGCTGGVIVHSGCGGGTVVVPSTPSKKIEPGTKTSDTGKKPEGGKKIEGGTTTKPGELTATEAKWLKEMMDAEKDPAKKKEIEKEFKSEPTGAGREAIYKLWKKDTGKGGDA